MFPFQLYQEVKLRRESNLNAFENKAIQSEAQKRPVHSPASEWSATSGLNCCLLDKESLLSRAEKEGKDTRNKRRNHVFEKDHLPLENYKESVDCPGLKTTKNYTQDLNIVSKLVTGILLTVKVTEGLAYNMSTPLINVCLMT